MKALKTNTLYTYLLFLLFCNAVSAANYTWTGTTNTSWNNSGNWSPAGIPSTNDNVTIGSTTNKPVLTANTTIKKLTMTGDTLNLNGDTLTVSDDAALSGGNIKNGHLKITAGNAVYSGTSFNVTINAVCNFNKFNGSTFNNNCVFETTSNSNVSSNGGSTFNGTVKYIKSGTGAGYNNLGTTTGNTFNSSLEIENHGTREIQLSDVGSNYYNGNIIVASVASGGVYFGSVNGGVSTLATTKTITVGAAGFSAGTLLLRDFTNTTSSGAIFNFTLSSTAVLNLISSTFNAPINITAPAVVLKDNVFNDTCKFSQTGAVRSNSDGGNTFNNYTVFNNNGNAGFRLGITTSDNFNGNVVFNGNVGTMQIGYATEVFFRKNLTCNGNINFLTGTYSKVTFAGSNAQSLYSNSYIEFGNCIVNKSGNGITLYAPVRMDSLLTFTKGKIYTDTINSLTIYTDGSVTGASDSSFIAGPVKKKGNTAFVFPTGKGNYLHPIAISAPAVNTNAYVAEYFNAAQTLGSTMDTTIDFLSTCGYWNLERVSGSSNVTVKLHWSATDCPILDSADLRIALWDGTKWKDKGNGTFTGTTAIGKLASPSAITSFNYFTLAYKTTPLPTAMLGNDTLLNGDAFTLTGTSNTHIRWYPDFHLSCDTCLSTTVDTLVTSVKYFLVATDYKGRIAVDSIFLHTLHKFSSITQYYPPQLDWKEDDWTLTNPLTSANQTKEQSGDEWWYGHENSFNIPSHSTEMNGYICAGYASFVNTPLIESAIGPNYGCFDNVIDYTDNECEDFETAGIDASSPGVHKGVFLTALGLKPLNGKGYTWYENYGAGYFLNVIQTADGGYLAVGRGNSTINYNTGDWIDYNPVDGQPPTHFNCTSPHLSKAYVVKANADGSMAWEKLYAPFSTADSSDMNYKVWATNVIETTNGYRVIGRYSNQITSSIFDCKGFYFDIDNSGNLLTQPGFDGYAFLPDVLGNGYDNDVTPWGITSYQDMGSTKYVISGIGQHIANDIPFYIPQKVFVMQMDESVLFPSTSNLDWANVTDFNNNPITLNSTNHYVKMSKSTTPEILVPVIENCSG